MALILHTTIHGQAQLKRNNEERMEKINANSQDAPRHLNSLSSFPFNKYFGFGRSRFWIIIIIINAFMVKVLDMWWFNVSSLALFLDFIVIKVNLIKQLPIDAIDSYGSNLACEFPWKFWISSEIGSYSSSLC